MYSNKYLDKVKTMRKDGKSDEEILHFLRLETKRLERAHNNWMAENGTKKEMESKYPNYHLDIEKIGVAIASVENIDFSKSNLFNQTSHRVAWAVLKDVNNLLFIKSKPMLKKGVQYAILNSSDPKFCKDLENALKKGTRTAVQEVINAHKGLDELISSKKNESKNNINLTSKDVER